MEYLTDAELKSLLAVAYRTDRTAHLAILVSLAHGMRVSEMRALTPQDVDGNCLHVRALKDGTARLEPLHACTDTLTDESMVAVHAHGCIVAGKPLLFGQSRQYWDRKIKSLCALAGIPSGKAHWHSLRHSAAMITFRATTSLGAVRQTLRHKSFSSSLVYLNESDSQKGFDAMSTGLEAIASL